MKQLNPSNVKEGAVTRSCTQCMTRKMFCLPVLLRVFHPVWALKRDGVCAYIYDSEEKNKKEVVTEVVRFGGGGGRGGSRL